MAGCAGWAREAGLDPSGTAPPAAAFVLVDWPRPWPRDAGDVPALAPLEGRARVQLVVPPEGTVRGGRVRVRAYARREGRATLGRAEGRARPDEVAAVAGALLAEAAAAPGEAAAEVLVCAHGARDRCCGALGTRLVAGTGVPVERTSHLGGHRFAPTALTLPDGRYWAFVDDEVLGAVVRRDGPVGAVLAHHRGSALVPSPALQLLDEVALARVGWAWDGWARSVVEGPRGSVGLEAVDGDGRRWAWSAVPGPVAEVAVPACGSGAPTTHRSPSLLAVRCAPPAGVALDTWSLLYHCD